MRNLQVYYVLLEQYNHILDKYDLVYKIGPMPFISAIEEAKRYNYTSCYRAEIYKKVINFNGEGVQGTGIKRKVSNAKKN